MLLFDFSSSPSRKQNSKSSSLEQGAYMQIRTAVHTSNSAFPKSACGSSGFLKHPLGFLSDLFFLFGLLCQLLSLLL